MASKRNITEVADATTGAPGVDAAKELRSKPNRKPRMKMPVQPAQAAAGAPMTKREHLVQLLSMKQGADLASISATLGWLPHTIRAAISGLRKAGHVILVVKGESGKPSRYRVQAPTQAAIAAAEAGDT